MPITSDNEPTDVLDAFELTPAERSDFGYLDWPALEEGRDSASFFRHKGEVYDLGTFERTEKGGELARAGWHGYRADSFFSAMIVRYLDEDCEQIIVGLYLT